MKYVNIIAQRLYEEGPKIVFQDLDKNRMSKDFYGKPLMNYLHALIFGDRFTRMSLCEYLKKLLPISEYAPWHHYLSFNKRLENDLEGEIFLDFFKGNLDIDDLPNNQKEILSFQKSIDLSLGKEYLKQSPLVSVWKQRQEQCFPPCTSKYIGVWIDGYQGTMDHLVEMIKLGYVVICLCPTEFHYIHAYVYLWNLGLKPQEWFICGKTDRINSCIEIILNPSTQQAFILLEQALITRKSEIYLLGKDVETIFWMDYIAHEDHFYLAYRRFFQDWTDPRSRKGYFLPYELSLSLQKKERKSIKTTQIRSAYKKIKVAHIVSMVREGTLHAPTRLVRSLIEYQDSQLETMIMSHESLVRRSSRYPQMTVWSSSSYEEASSFIEELRNQGTSVWIETEFLSDSSTVDKMQSYIQEHSIDVLIFHEWLPMNALLCSLNTTCKTIFFDHGTHHPLGPCVDHVIASNQESAAFFSSLLSSNQVDYLPYAINCRESWKQPPFLKSEWGFQSTDLLITTVSNHLEDRLSDEMCYAIRQILQTVPDCYYVPIGKVRDPDALMRKIGVEGRVFFLGQHNYPSHLVRSMDLYLNEFPFGGGLSVLDAMASGCCVVTMYDENGPPQNRFGGIYFGKHRSIVSLKNEDYVALACRLLLEENLRNQWKEETLQRFDEIVNVQKYAQKFEDIVVDLVCVTKSSNV